MAYTLQSKVGDFLKDPNGLVVLGQYLEEVSKNPLVDMIKGIAIEDILELPQLKEFGITKAMVQGGLNDINTRVSKLK